MSKAAADKASSRPFDQFKELRPDVRRMHIGPNTFFGQFQFGYRDQHLHQPPMNISGKALPLMIDFLVPFRDRSLDSSLALGLADILEFVVCPDLSCRVEAVSVMDKKPQILIDCGQFWLCKR